MYAIQNYVTTLFKKSTQGPDLSSIVPDHVDPSPRKTFIKLSCSSPMYEFR